MLLAREPQGTQLNLPESMNQFLCMAFAQLTFRESLRFDPCHRRKEPSSVMRPLKPAMR